MLPRVPRYTHVPAAIVSVLLLFVVIAWLLARPGDGLWDPGLRLAAPGAPVVTLSPEPREASPLAPAVAAPSAPEPAAAAPDRRRTPEATPPAADRYALESGPFASPELADRVEDRLNEMGHATIRFRKQDPTRLYVVALTGFPSGEEAERAVRELGRGAVVDIAGGASEVLVAQLPTLGEAVAAARPLRARGFQVRVSEALSPALIYHVRYGQFGSRAEAQARSDELTRSGIRSRVVKVR